jgi:AcrR family transcriptional regulator
VAAETVGQPAELPNRLERRKQRTRAALIQAAQVFIGAGKLNAPILEITQAADVGMGSFYNYFDSKDELFAAALNEVLDAHGALLDRVTESLDDPAETFACSFRLTGRLFRRRPQESRVLLATGVLLTSADRGLAPRALRDIVAAIRAKRFRIDDPTLALALAGGALMGLGQLLAAEPNRDDAQATDRVAEDMLRMFGMDADEARDICQRSLPDLDQHQA